MAGKTGLGVFEAAKAQDKYAIGGDSDQKYIDPVNIICFMKKDIAGSVYSFVSRYIEGGDFSTAAPSGKGYDHRLRGHPATATTP